MVLYLKPFIAAGLDIITYQDISELDLKSMLFHKNQRSITLLCKNKITSTYEASMLHDPVLMSAVSRIHQRSERQEDIDKLIGTYVDVGLLPQLNNTNHQVFYGRRGTGKTHVMKVLQTDLTKQTRDVVVYIDCRTLGSTSQFSDATIPMQKRCLSLFRDILLCVYHSLLEYIVDNPNENSNESLLAVDELANLITEPKNTYTPERSKTEHQSSASNQLEKGANIGISSNPAVTFKYGKTTESESKNQLETEYSVTVEDKVIFPELQRSIKKVLDLASTRIYILIDEWSSLPLDIQPFLSEFIKRGLLPLNTVTVKISALEYRCRFTQRTTNGLLGFELGADISTAPDLDDYFVFDRNPEKISDICADVLLKHIGSELPQDYLKDKYGIKTHSQFQSKMFTETKTFSELTRASEGVVRDLINIFTQSFFHAQRRGRDNIDKQAVVESARKWFEQDKAQYLDEHLEAVMRRIVDEVIGKRAARSFMLSRDLEKNPTIQRLFDARVLHHMRRGYADKDNPGARYNIYAIDYGAYVDLIGTSKQPQIDLIYDEVDTVSHEDSKEIIVPFDDKRSIRRIILSESILT